MAPLIVGQWVAVGWIPVVRKRVAGRFGEAEPSGRPELLPIRTKLPRTQLEVSCALEVSGDEM
jgi:hypothetical protein